MMHQNLKDYYADLVKTQSENTKAFISVNQGLSELKSDIKEHDLKREKCQNELKSYVHNNFYGKAEMDSKFKVFVYMSVMTTVAAISSVAGLLYMITKIAAGQ